MAKVTRKWLNMWKAINRMVSIINSIIPGCVVWCEQVSHSFMFREKENDVIFLAVAGEFGQASLFSMSTRWVRENRYTQHYSILNVYTVCVYLNWYIDGNDGGPVLPSKFCSSPNTSYFIISIDTSILYGQNILTIVIYCFEPCTFLCTYTFNFYIAAIFTYGTAQRQLDGIHSCKSIDYCGQIEKAWAKLWYLWVSLCGLYMNAIEQKVFGDVGVYVYSQINIPSGRGAI